MTADAPLPVCRPLLGSAPSAVRRAAYRRRLAVLLAVRRVERGRDTTAGSRPRRPVTPDAFRPRPPV